MNDTKQNTTTVYGVRAITADDKIGWIDQAVEGGPSHKENPFVGGYAYGIGPTGHDQHMIHANSGSPVLGYWFDEEGELHLTALIGGRWNLEGGSHLPEVIGGFALVNPETGEKSLPKSGALRELLEEAGIELDDVIPTGGAPFIGDRAFFWKLVGEGNNVFMFPLRDTHVEHIRLNPQLELKHWCDFIDETVDGITFGSIARVMMALSRSGMLKVVKA